jgi:hypothetical protein
MSSYQKPNSRRNINIFNPYDFNITSTTSSNVNLVQLDQRFVKLRTYQTITGQKNFTEAIELTTDNLSTQISTSGSNFLVSRSVNLPTGSNYKINNIDLIPSQNGNSGRFLSTNGSSASWSVVDALPSQSGNSGRYLTTNGSLPSWNLIPTASPGGSNQQIQYNSNGTFGASSSFYYNSVENRLYTQYALIGDDMQVSTNLLRTDSTNGRVGINKAEPQYSLDIVGDLNYTGALRRNGTAVNFITPPAGSNTQVQFNSAGAFGSSSSLLFNNITNTLTTHNLDIGNNLTLTTIPNTSTDFILRYNPTSKLVSYSTFPTGGSDNSIQFKSGNSLSGNSNFQYNSALGYLSIITDGGSPYMRIREQTNANSIMDLSPDALVFRDQDDNTLSSYAYNGANTTKLYLTDNNNPVNSLQYKKSDNEIAGEDALRFQNNILTAPSITTGTITASSIVLTGSSGSTGGTTSSGGSGFAQFSMTSNSAQIPQSSAGSPYTNTHTVIFNNQLSNTITGLSQDSGGLFIVPKGGLYFVTSSVFWGNWSNGYRFAWLAIGIYSGRVGINSVNTQSASGGGSPPIAVSSIIDTRNLTSDTFFRVQTSQTSGAQNASTVVSSGTSITIIRIA